MMGYRARGSHENETGGANRTAFLGAFALVLAAFSASTCASHLADLITIPCDTTQDCIDKGYPGTTCRDDGRCACAPGEDYCGRCVPNGTCPDAGETDGGGGTGQGNPCTVAADCPQPGDPRCGTATCEDGACGLKLKPFAKLASQIAGDCKELWCDGFGNLTELPDGSDTYDDGSQCTMDICQAGQAKNQPYPNASVCPETGTGYCYSGACVTCIPNMTFCAPGFVCDGLLCVPMDCENDQWDQGLGETAKDCGGPCRPCDPGNGCKIPEDCAQGVCAGGICPLPTCTDGVRNDEETGVDCGGPTGCPLCPAGEGCKAAADCLSKVCWAGKCQPPKCDDGIQNGDETDWDCGGACAPCP